MANIVDDEGIAIGPAVKVGDGGGIAGKERLLEGSPGGGFGPQTEAV